VGRFDEKLATLLASEYDSDFVAAALVSLKLGEVQSANTLTPFRLLISSRSETLRSELSKLLLFQPLAVVGHIPSIFPVVGNAESRSEAFFVFLGELLPKVGDTELIFTNKGI
jgi:hypothetical protein